MFEYFVLPQIKEKAKHKQGNHYMQQKYICTHNEQETIKNFFMTLILSESHSYTHYIAFVSSFNHAYTFHIYGLFYLFKQQLTSEKLVCFLEHTKHSQKTGIKEEIMGQIKNFMKSLNSHENHIQMILIQRKTQQIFHRLPFTHFL